jgi:hypothetical protein
MPLLASNFTSNLLYGTTIVAGGWANVDLTVDAFAFEGDKTFAVKLRKDSTLGQVIGTSAPITIKDYTTIVGLSANISTVNEGNLVQFTLTTTNVVNYTNVAYSVFPATANVTADDFVANTGYITIINNVGTFALKANADVSLIDENGENFRVQIRDKNSTNVFISSNITIGDVSRGINVLRFVENSSTISEGGTLTLTFTATNANNVIIFYSTDGNATSSTFTGGNTGSFVMNSTSNTFTLLPTGVPYGTTQNFRVVLRSDTATGPIVTTSNNIIAVDGAIAYMNATGGDSAYVTSDGYKIHRYNSSGTLNVTNLGLASNIEYLVIGGGGGGGDSGGQSAGSGGGGSGQVRTGYTLLPSTGNYVVTIAGGAGGRNVKAANSNIYLAPAGFAIESQGGTTGGARAYLDGGNGGSSGNGFGGGGDFGSGGGGGGGGGATAVGNPAPGNPGGPGGAGQTVTILGYSIAVAGGGGGGGGPSSPDGNGGSGGGGPGGSGGGLINSGSGGGGGSGPSRPGSSGGSGLVIIKYPYVSPPVVNSVTTTASAFAVGGNITFTVSTTDANTLTLYYTTEGNVDSSYFIGGNTGSFVANANGNVFTLIGNTNAIVPVGQTRNFRLQIRQDSSTGFISGSGSNIALYNYSDYYVQATGGQATIDSAGYRMHVFTTSANLTVTSVGATGLEYLLVAGGGGGGTGYYGFYGGGGGGGAGGLLNTSIALPTTGNIIVTVGGGGTDNSTGGNTTLSGIVSANAFGGGGGISVNNNGRPGGSGGGGSTSLGGSSYGLGTTGQGFRGGLSSPITVGGATNNEMAGGGGGAGEIGHWTSGDPTSAATSTVAGGRGLGISWVPASYGTTGATTGRWFAGGGGGGNSPAGQAALQHGGAGGGGYGGAYYGANSAQSVGLQRGGQDGGGSATINTGGGGGGVGSAGAGSGTGLPGLGGSGIVIIRYPIA